MSILSSILSILDWGKDKIPIQDRIERWKNEIDKLEERQKFIETNQRNDLRAEYKRNAKQLQKLHNFCKNKVA